MGIHLEDLSGIFIWKDIIRPVRSWQRSGCLFRTTDKTARHEYSWANVQPIIVSGGITVRTDLRILPGRFESFPDSFEKSPDDCSGRFTATTRHKYSTRYNVTAAFKSTLPKHYSRQLPVVQNRTVTFLLQQNRRFLWWDCDLFETLLSRCTSSLTYR